MQRKRPSALSPELILAPKDSSTACKGVMPHGQQAELPHNVQQELPTCKLPVVEVPAVNLEPMTPQVQALLENRYHVLPNRMIEEGWYQVCRGGCFRRTAFLVKDRQRRQMACCLACADKHFRQDPQLCYMNLPTRQQKKAKTMTPTQEHAVRLMQAHVLAFVASDHKSAGLAEQPANTNGNAEKHAIKCKRGRSDDEEQGTERPVRKQACRSASPASTCAAINAEQDVKSQHARSDTEEPDSARPVWMQAHVPALFTSYPTQPSGYMHGYAMHYQVPNTMQGIRERQAAVMRTLHGVPKSSPVYLEMKAQAYRIWHELEARFVALHEAWCAHNHMG